MLSILSSTIYIYFLSTFMCNGLRLFYVVTAYGGDMGRMQALVAQKKEWKYGELENALKENGIQHLDIMK